MLVHRRVTPNIKFAGTHLYTWVERGTVEVKCLAQKHNPMSPARARTQTARSRVERTNQATAPPILKVGHRNFQASLVLVASGLAVILLSFLPDTEL